MTDVLDTASLIAVTECWLTFMWNIFFKAFLIVTIWDLSGGFLMITKILFLNIIGLGYN